MSSKSKTLTLDWTPHPQQAEVLSADSRFKIVGCGRRWGKTELAAHAVLEALGDPETLVWWVAPTYDIGDIGFGVMEEIIPRQFMAGEPKQTKPKAIELTNGSEVSVRSADREDSLRGEGIDLLVLDEAAMVPNRAWTKELRPTLTDTLGDMVAISTPKGRNWFFEWFERGTSEDHPDVSSWQYPTKGNPHIPTEEIQAAKRELPARVFEQEYLAEFSQESGGVFTNLEDLLFTLGEPVEDPTPPFASGWDFARHEDYLVGTVLDSEGRVVDHQRSRGDAWPHIQQRIEETTEQYPGIVALDASRDNKIVADLETALRGTATVEPVTFSPKRKRGLVEDLITMVESEELAAPDIPQLQTEMSVFEYNITPSGNVSYQAPPGFHDDCVDSLALAADQLGRIRGHRQDRTNDRNGIHFR